MSKKKEKPKDFPPLMSLRKFANLVDISIDTARECANGESKNYPPLRAKKSAGERPRYYITREAAEEWITNLDNA